MRAGGRPAIFTITPIVCQGRATSTEPKCSSLPSGAPLPVGAVRWFLSGVEWLADGSPVLLREEILGCEQGRGALLQARADEPTQQQQLPDARLHAVGVLGQYHQCSGGLADGGRDSRIDASSLQDRMR